MSVISTEELCVYILLLFSAKAVIAAEGCTNGFPDMNLIITRASGTTTGAKLSEGLSILNAFTCSGILTGLVLGVDVRTEADGRSLYPEVSLWRPEEQDELDGDYDIVSGSERTVWLTPANFSTSGVFNYPLDPPLYFKTNDILGWYQPEGMESVVRMYTIDGSDFMLTRIIPDSVSLNSFDLEDSKSSNSVLLLYPVTDSEPSCIDQQFLSEQTVRSQALMISKIKKRDSTQRIFPDMYFSCAGLLTKWIIGGEPRMSMNPFPELQLWRTSDGTNYFKTSVSLISTVPNITLHTNVYEYILDSPLEFQEGDVFGLYKPKESESVLNIFLQEHSGPFAYGQQDTTDSVLTEIMVESTMLLNQNDYPMVSVEILIISSNTTVPSSTIETIISVTATNDIKITSTLGIRSLVMGSATHTDDTSNISPSPTSESLLEEEGSVVIAVAVILAVIAIIVLLLVLIVIGIVILKVNGKKSFTLNAMSHYEFEYSYNKADDGKSTLKSSILAKPVTGEISVANPVYEIEEDKKSSHGISSSSPGQAATRTLSSLGPEPVDMGDESAFPYSVPIKNNQVDSYYSPVFVPTMAERLKTAQDQQQQADIQHNYSTLERQSFFVENEIYWNPGSDCSSIFEQLAQNRFREISRQQIQAISHLGSGQFGQVSKGVWYSPAGPKEVAIKTLQDNANEVDKIKFLQEAAIMGQFHHPNVITLYGVVTVEEPVMIVLELMKNGDLRQHLHSLRPLPGELLSSSEECTLLDFCCQIALGMEYLSRKSFIHRDLAARNILVSVQRHCKIADFGMSRDLQNEDYYTSSGGQIPIKWTAPEAILYKKYSTASDVWSFGALMYEIWSLGHKPFEDKTNQQAYHSISDGYRLSPPPGCPRAVYQLMIQCWHPETAGRPSFASLVSHLSQPDKRLLVWSDEDRNSHPQAIVLGAPLEAGTLLYPLLQKTYMCTQS